MALNALRNLVLCGVFGSVAMIGSAMAQDVTMSDDVYRLASSPPGAPPPGPLTGIGNSLRSMGIDMRLDFVNLYSNTPNFGYDPGRAMNYGFMLFDTTYHITDNISLNWRETINVPMYNADKYLIEVSNGFFSTFPVIDTFSDLTRLSLQGTFLDGKLELEGGRLNMWPEFFRSEYCAGIACVAQIRALVLNAPGNTLSEWGGRVGYNLAPNISLGAILTEDNPQNWQTGSGWDWAQGNSQGYIAVAHLAQRESFMQSDLPLSYEIGAYRGSASYYDALYNPGWGNPTYGPNQVNILHDGGTNGLYGQARKVVWSAPNGTPFPENVAIYGGVFHTFGEGQAYPWEAYGGVEYGGFWKANPLTTVGFTVHYLGLSEKRAAYETNARLFFSGVYDAQPQDTFQFDVHTRFGISQLGFLEVGAAYMLNPNTTIMADYSTSRQKDGVVIYAGLYFDLGTAVGLSQPMRH